MARIEILSEESRSRSTSEKPKWAIAGILAAVLGFILTGSNDGEVKVDTAANDAREQSNVEVGGEDVARKQRFLPAISLEEILGHNPFSFQDARVDQNEIALRRKLEDHRKRQQARAASASLQALRGKQAVTFLFKSRQGSAAVWGNRIVREGDEVDGVRIVEIQADGILVEAVTAETEDQAGKL